MYLLEQFIQSILLVLFLTVVSVADSAYAQLYIFSASCLIVCFTFRSLSEENNILFCLVQIVQTLLFIAFSGNFLSFLLIYEVRFLERRFCYGRMLAPGICYGAIQLLWKNKPLPMVLAHILLLFTIAFGLLILEKLLQSYLMIREQNEMTMKVMAVNEMVQKKLNHELVMKNYLIDKNARFQERENISRNIHNSVGHTITASIMTLDAADMLFDTAPQQARQKMQTAQERMRESLDAIRHAVRVLDTEKKDIKITDFVREITCLSESFVMDTTIRIRSNVTGIDASISLSKEHAEFLTGAYKEALSNGVRHGNADLFTVLLIADSTHIQLSVKDNGNSDFSEENCKERIKTGFGLKKIQNYVCRCGGSVQFENTGGFKLTITLPLSKGEEDE